MGTILVPLPGWKVIRRRTQIRRMDIMQTGRATKNQTSQLGTGSMFWRAMMFWGEAMGEAAPPTLAARAIPRMRALEKRESEGRFRRRGYVARGQFHRAGGIRDNIRKKIIPERSRSIGPALRHC